MPVKKLGIFGGTFDPIHNGHLRVIVELLTRKIVDKIILIPAGDPLLRKQPPVADGSTRFEMCKLAIQDLPNGIKDQVTVSDIEINRAGPTYAIDTVKELAKSGDELFWIIGSDAYEKIDKWHRADELREQVSFIVIDRPGDGGKGLDIGALDISATNIRSRIKSRSGEEANGTSPSVRKYITERNLYAGK